MNQDATSNRSAMVTGASGFLGSLLVSTLNKMGWTVFAVSRQNSFSHLPNVTHIPHDWNRQVAFEIPQVDTIFHLAAQTSAYKARDSVSKDIWTNVVGTAHLLECIARSKIKPVFIFTGSMTEYGIHSTLPTDERIPLNPHTFYDVGKIATQLYAEQFVREGWLSKSITLRLSNVYGKTTQVPSSDRGFLDRSMVRALSGDPIFYFGTGKYIRDFLHVNDVIRALISVSLHAENLNFTAFNIGTGFGITIKEALSLIAKEAEELTGRPVELLPADFPINSYSIEKRDSIVNSQAFRSLTGWIPEIDIKTGVKKSLVELWSQIRT